MDRQHVRQALAASIINNQMITSAWIFTVTLWTITLIAFYVFEI